MFGGRRDVFLSVLLVAVCLATPTLAYAADSQLGSSGIMNEVLHRFHDATQKWLPEIKQAAERLFLALATISMVWTFGLMLMRKADIGEFFTEMIRFLVVFGFFWWLLKNAMEGEKIADTIVRSMSQLGSSAGKLGTTDLKPSTIVDLGFDLYDRTVEATNKLSWYQMGRQITMELMAIAILLVLAIVSINLLVLLASSWFLLYAGVFFLGFGGSRWTSDMALNYYRAVFGVGAQLFAMVLLIAIGKDFIETFAAKISDKVAVQELAVMLVVSALLLILVNKIPPMVAALVGGAGSASTGIGNFGAGAAVGAATTAASMMGKGASAVMSAGANAIGAGQAIHSAFKGAQSSVSAGTDLASRMLGGPSSASSGSPSGGNPGGASPLSAEMGLASAASAGGAQVASAAGGGAESTSAGESSAGGGSESSAGGGGGGDGGAESASAGGGGSAEGDSGSQGGGDAGGQSASGGGGGGGSQGGKGEGGGGSSSSKMGNAGRIALQMTANLAGGLGRAAQSRIDKTAGGRLAMEIANPGSTRRANPNAQSTSRDFEPDSEVKSFSESKQDKT